MTRNRIFSLITLGLALFFAFITCFESSFDVGADEVVVIQTPSGKQEV